METRKPKLHICDDLGLEETLEAFKSGPFPSTKDVLRHFFFHFWSMAKRDANEAAWRTTDALLTLWAPSYLPLMTRVNVRKKVQRLYDLYHSVRYGLRKNQKPGRAYLDKKQKFLEELNQRFDVSAERAVDLILSDKTLSTAEKQEDLEFLNRIRANLPASLGVLDVKRIKRLEKAAERERQAAARELKEEQRKMVCYV